MRMYILDCCLWIHAEKPTVSEDWVRVMGIEIKPVQSDFYIDSTIIWIGAARIFMLILS